MKKENFQRCPFHTAAPILNALGIQSTNAMDSTSHVKIDKHFPKLPKNDLLSLPAPRYISYYFSQI